jgi:hypothetical protein
MAYICAQPFATIGTKIQFMSRFHLATLFSIVLLAWNTGSAQQKVTWDDLTDVVFKEKYVKSVDSYYLFPEFGPEVKKYEGKQIVISGYMLVLDPKAEFYVLSKGPFASCFFCGAAGPETIMEVQFKSKNHKRYKMDDRVTLRGVFKLNKDDIEHCNYILEVAEEY